MVLGDTLKGFSVIVEKYGQTVWDFMGMMLEWNSHRDKTTKILSQTSCGRLDGFPSWKIFELKSVESRKLFLTSVRARGY